MTPRVTTTIGAAVTALVPLLGGLAAAAGLGSTVSWPQPGRNAQHTGYNASETVLGAGNVGTLVQRWTLATSAAIAAPPVLQGKRAYLLSTNGTLYAVNAKTGAVLWTFTAAANGAPASWGIVANADSVFVNCQLDYDGGTIINGHGGVCALNAATGALLWSYAIYNDGGTPVDSAPYGAPVLNGSTLVLGEADSASFAHVGYEVFLNAPTGQVTNLVGNCGDTLANDCNFVSSAPAAAQQGAIYYNSGITDEQGYIGALCSLGENASSPNWCYDTTDYNLAPAISGGKVLFDEVDGSASAIVALDEASGAVAWTTKVAATDGTQHFAPAIANGLAYFSIGSNGFNTLYAVSLKTGKVKWSYAGGAAGWVSSGVTVANGVVYAVCRSATDQCAFDAKTGAVLRAQGGTGQSPASPLVANGAILSVCGFNNLCDYSP
jgi:outer membrane protein assembly factor BamB